MTENLASLSAKLAPRFADLGFTVIRDGHWLRHDDRPVREHIRLQSMKGAQFSFCWGFDLKFCPILVSGRLVSKAGAKAAMDLVFDPIDDSGRVEAWHSFDVSAPANLVSSTMEKCAQVAQARFDSVNSVEGLIAAFEGRAVAPTKRFGLKNYIQTDLCWGLALISAGRVVDGEEHLARFREKNQIAVTDPALSKAVSFAQNLVGVPA